MTKENTKSGNKKETDPDKRWTNKNGGKEQQLEPGEKENDRNGWSYKEKQHREMGEHRRGRGRMWSSKGPWASHHYWEGRCLLSLRRRKRGFHDPLRVRTSSLFILFRWSSNSIASLMSRSM
jgi:hypothetical protein